MGQIFYLENIPFTQDPDADNPGYTVVLADAAKLYSTWQQDRAEFPWGMPFVPNSDELRIRAQSGMIDSSDAKTSLRKITQFSAFLEDRLTRAESTGESIAIHMPRLDGQPIISYSEGRHRTVTLVERGLQVIPLAVPVQAADTIIERVGATSAMLPDTQDIGVREILRHQDDVIMKKLARDLAPVLQGMARDVQVLEDVEGPTRIEEKASGHKQHQIISGNSMNNEQERRVAETLHLLGITDMSVNSHILTIRDDQQYARFEAVRAALRQHVLPEGFTNSSGATRTFHKR